MCEHNVEGEQQINHLAGLLYPINAPFSKGLPAVLGWFFFSCSLNQRIMEKQRKEMVVLRHCASYKECVKGL